MKIRLAILFITFHLIATCSKANISYFISLSDYKYGAASIPKPDSINKKRILIISNSTFYGSTYLGFYYLWYKNYELTSFHFFDDSGEWLQIDKTGHIYSSYYLTKLQSEVIEWSGVKKSNALKYGALTALAYVSTIEVLDGFSKDWGASLSDMSANLFGIGLYTLQELSFQKQYIVPKFSYNFNSHINLRPELLGSNSIEQILKDYNGQNYWFSANISNIISIENFPKWLNIAFGYGGANMLGGHFNPPEFSSYNRYRQYYISLDLDVKKIDTKKRWLNFIIHQLNFVKIPLPTIEYSNKNWKFYPVYF